MSQYNAKRQAEQYIENERGLTEDDNYDLYYELIQDAELQEIAIARYRVGYSVHRDIQHHLDRAKQELTQALDIRADEVEERFVSEIVEIEESDL